MWCLSTKDNFSSIIVFAFFLQGAGTDKEALTEILCTLSNAQLAEVKAIYEQSALFSLL